MSWCCGELVRSEERTRSPRICATAVPLVEHLDLERKDLKRKENLRMAVQRCKEQRETIRSLRVHNSKLKDENIQLRRTTEEGYEERVTELREAYDKNLRERYEERVRSLIERNRRVIEAYEEENSQLREAIIQLYRLLYPDDPNVHTPEEQLVARLEERLARLTLEIPQHDEEDERWEQPHDPADDAGEFR